jgi:hypothetical protein
VTLLRSLSESHQCRGTIDQPIGQCATPDTCRPVLECCKRTARDGRTYPQPNRCIWHSSFRLGARSNILSTGPGATAFATAIRSFREHSPPIEMANARESGEKVNKQKVRESCNACSSQKIVSGDNMACAHKVRLTCRHRSDVARNDRLAVDVSIRGWLVNTAYQNGPDNAVRRMPAILTC